MAATADHETKRSEGEVKSYQIAASTKIYKGVAVGVNASGFLLEMAHGTAGLQYQGVSLEQGDNSAGAAGALSIRVRKTGEYSFVFNGADAVQGDVGQVAYAVDGLTVDDDINAVTYAYPIGKIVEVVSGSEVRVAIDGYSVLNALVSGGHVTANDITGVDSSLDIVGQAGTGAVGGVVNVTGGAGSAAQAGGAVALVGGVPVSGNAAGGAASVAGGAGSGTGNGGAAAVAGGTTGGGATGTGGAVSLTGGANNNATNGAGGAAAVAGGAGKGSGAGGAASLTGGAGGTTGAGGAVTVAGGASAGAGGTAGAVLIHAGAVAGGAGASVAITKGDGTTKLIEANETGIGFFATAPTAKHATTGDVTGFVAGGGTASKSDSVYAGAAGATAYTVGDLVTCLKAKGLLTA